MTSTMTKLRKRTTCS